MSNEIDEQLIDEMIEQAFGRVQVTVIDQAFLDARAEKAGLIRKCIYPSCDKQVDLRQRASGACCKAHMNYICTHPDCLEKAKAKGWDHYSHRCGTKIAQDHWEYKS